MTPGQIALLLGGVALVCAGVAVTVPAIRELAVVVGLALAFLAGGVLNWDRRGGH
ncbi:MAG: hypothetical protein M3442_06130 [Chloroflexota bacterium]|jgi:hypothetical protein|nr:hypothetical protein [Chloroflexota bacterium]